MTVVLRQPRQVLPGDVFGRDEVARHRVLELGDGLFKHREGRWRGCGRPVDDLRSLQGRQAAQVRRGHQLPGDCGHARDLGPGGRHLRIGSGIDGFPSYQRVLERNGRATTGIVDLREPLHDERHQGRGLARAQAQREDIADVRGVHPRPGRVEGIAVDVADRCQRTAAGAQHVRGRPVTRGAVNRLSRALRVLHHRDKTVGRVDLLIATGGDRHGRPPAILARPDGATPGDAHRSLVSGRVGERIEVPQVGGVLRRADPPGNDDALVPGGGGRVEVAGAIVVQAEAMQILIGDHQRVVRAPHLELEIAKAIERVGAPAGGNAAAVLRPRRGVLEVPELAVARRHARNGDDADGTHRRADGRKGQCLEGSHHAEYK